MPVFVKAHMKGRSQVRSYYRNQKASDHIARRLGSYKNVHVANNRVNTLRRLGKMQLKTQGMILTKMAMARQLIGGPNRQAFFGSHKKY